MHGSSHLRSRPKYFIPRVILTVHLTGFFFLFLLSKKALFYFEVGIETIRVTVFAIFHENVVVMGL